MPKRVPTKFRTVHKFGKRRRRRKSGDQGSVMQESELEVEASATAEPEPSTSAAPEPVIASGRKIQYFKGRKQAEESSDEDSEPGPSKKAKRQEIEGAEEEPLSTTNMNMIVNVRCLQSWITASGALCPQCKQPSLRVIEGGPGLRMGSACHLELACIDCGKLSGEWMSEKTGTAHTGYNINRRVVAASASTGFTFSQVNRFFALLNMPQPMNESTWYFYKKRISSGARRAADRHLQEAADQVRTVYADMNIGIPDHDGILDISISIDGSWQKRGRTSHNGIVTVIEIMTGLVLDFVTLSNFCRVCETGPKPGDDGYENWFTTHQADCQKNVNCSSPAMEMEGAVILFSRSVRLHGFRYTQMLGDGDAKTHKKLLDVDPYDGRPIEKLECINHVTKRMGTALRTLVEKRKSAGEPVGGRGKLTEVRIKQLTNYYGKAIKDNSGNLDEMQCAVWASFFHSVSNDETHNHDYCPKGSSSWCSFQRAIADGVPPPPHKKPLPDSVAQALKPVFQRLGDPQLLRRCLDGKTQNSNESFHSLLWSLCPKEKWSSLRTVETALAIATQRYNKGSTAHLDILFQLELVAGDRMEEYAEKEDTVRVVRATRKTSGKEKQKRKRIEAVKRQERQDREEREGLVYGAGQF